MFVTLREENHYENGRDRTVCDCIGCDYRGGRLYLEKVIGKANNPKLRHVLVIDLVNVEFAHINMG